ncbi:MAG: PRC-barrel domain-containing protein, partial [Pseudomonadota bacterium]|nr:PRC-barrel domain-containing protein [Pseudomonadota bacterium]
MTTAMIAVGATGAFAQTQTEAPAADAKPAEVQASTNSSFRAEAGPMEVQASDFIGMRVYTAENATDADSYAGIQDNWEDIGEIHDVILSRDGAVEAVLVDIGGFLGIGERQVAVNMDAIKFVSDDATEGDDSDYFLVMNGTKASFEEAPEYRTSGMAGDAAMTAPADQTAAVTTEEPVETEAEQMAESAEQSVENAAESTEQMAENAAESTEQMAENAAENVDQAADSAAAEIDQTADAAETEIEQAADAAEAETDEAVANADAAATTMTEPREGFEVVKVDAITSEELTGARVYDAKQNWIGEISELLMADGATVDKAVIDVGGFLGIGEKPVAVNADELDVERAVDGGDIRIHVNKTKEELEAMATYEKQ